MINIDTNQARLDLYPQKYPQPFHAGACFAIQKDLLLVGHLFGVSPIMGPPFGYSGCEYLDDERGCLLRRPTALQSVSIRAHPLGSPFRSVLCSVALRFAFRLPSMLGSVSVSFLRKLDNIGAANPCAAWLWPWLLSLGWLADLRNLGD